MNEMRRLPVKSETEEYERDQCRLRMALLVVGIAILFALALGFNLWLDSGCEIAGVITTEGKACI